MKIENHKYVESYWVEELPNGVIHLLINCKQREIYFHQFNDYEILVCGAKEEYDNWTFENVLKTEQFLDKNKTWMYLRTEMKEDEQLSFYYIPYQKDWYRNRKYLIK